MPKVKSIEPEVFKDKIVDYLEDHFSFRGEKWRDLSVTFKNNWYQPKKRFGHQVVRNNFRAGHKVKPILKRGVQQNSWSLDHRFGLVAASVPSQAGPRLGPRVCASRATEYQPVQGNLYKLPREDSDCKSDWRYQNQRFQRKKLNGRKKQWSPQRENTRPFKSFINKDFVVKKRVTFSDFSKRSKSVI